MGIHPTGERPGNLLGSPRFAPKCRYMGQDENIGTLRSRLSALVEREGELLTQAFDLSQGGGDRRGVDALFAQVQAIQVERNSLKKQIGNIIGTHRLHEASEVWKLGIYDYRPEVGADSVRVRVTRGPLGLQVVLPHRPDGVSIETLRGTFDGPLAVDDGPGHAAPADLQGCVFTDSPGAAPGDKAKTRKRAGGKKNPV